MSEHTIYEAMVQQVAGLAAERDVLLARLAEKAESDGIEDALRKQVAGLRTERDLLRAERDVLKAKLDALEAKCEALQLAEWRASYSLEEACKQVAALVEERDALKEELDGAYYRTADE